MKLQPQGPEDYDFQGVTIEMVKVLETKLNFTAIYSPDLKSTTLGRKRVKGLNLVERIIVFKLIFEFSRRVNGQE